MTTRSSNVSPSSCPNIRRQPLLRSSGSTAPVRDAGAGLALVALLAASGCGGRAARPDTQAVEIGKLRGELAAQGQRIKLIEENLAEGLKAALCPKTIMGLMRDVNKCTAGTACTNPEIARDIANLVQKNDPTHKGRFISLMDTQPHIAVYLVNGPRALSDEEVIRLKELVAPPWLPSTRFLVISHPDPAEPANMVAAEKRGRSIIEAIAEMHFPEFPGLQISQGDRVLHWIFHFSKRGERYRDIDAGGPVQKSVWVFRVNC